ncbi:MAG: GrpB family protein [Verrucomicrobiae bacterium]|nr:GrpB family protein [Verrucomicrobiae bacterium]
METLEQKIQRVVKEDVALTPYNPVWPKLFEREKDHLLTCLPRELIGRIEHFGSTAIPGMAAKPIIDLLVEVYSLEQTKKRIAPILESQGYDYFWRPSMFDGPPYYAWFIKRNNERVRTHHIHMVEPRFDHWNRLFFRDYLIAHPEVAREYQTLKFRLAAEHPNDRIAYTKGKTEFVVKVTEQAIQFYQKADRNS